MADAVKHTPGPWDIRTLENFGWNVVHYRNGDKFDVQRVAKCASETDARIIAAAPDLLESIKVLLSNYDAGNYAAIDMPAIRAAVAKAEGSV